jgi:hypothetical protein
LADRQIDVEDSALMRARSWRWLRVRILGLLDVPPCGFRDVTTGSGKTAKTHAQPLWATRIQSAIYTKERPTG